MADVSPRAKWHSFPRGIWTWPEVMPGDMVVCPGVFAYAWQDYHDRAFNFAFSLAHRPILIIARYRYVKSSQSEESTLTQADVDMMATFVALTQHGIVCIPMNVFHSDRWPATSNDLL